MEDIKIVTALMSVLTFVAVLVCSIAYFAVWLSKLV
jgi:hypothetical protein